MVRNLLVPVSSTRAATLLVTGTPHRGVYQLYQLQGWYGFRNVPVRTSWRWRGESA